MFSSTSYGPPGNAPRNPRRRQRNGSEDSVALRQNPKRLRRSGLTHETFQPPEAPKANGHIKPAADHPISNGHVQAAVRQDVSVDTTSLTTRDRGTTSTDKERRSGYIQEGTDLTKNDNYVVTQLPTTPDDIRRLSHSHSWNGEIFTKPGYALATTHEHAIVWRYSQSQASGQAMKPLTVRLLQPSNSRHPIPLGLLIPSPGDPSLLVVMPASGKITYWESLTAAANSDPNRQKQQCLQGAVNGMMSGETITSVCEGEPHGFVLTFSSGRVAHMAISDVQGKPSIVVQFLRNDAVRSGGLFGGLRNVFSTAGWKRDIAAVHPGISLQRGHRQIVVATTKSVFQIWDLNWNGTQSLVHEIDGKESFLKALEEGGDVFHDRYDHHFEVLDFTFKPKKLAMAENIAIAATPKRGDCELYVVTVLHGTEHSIYNLLGLTLANGSLTVDVVHPISCYRSPLPKDMKFKPQITVPQPGQTAFVVFEKSIVLVALDTIPGNPDTQLLADADELPGPFQDTIEFNKEKPYRSVACVAEPADSQSSPASCAILVHAYGMVRISALPVSQVSSAQDRARVTARTKIEQAIFFGNLPQDLLDFSGRSEIKYSKDQVESAAKEISDSILRNTSSYIPRSMPSMENQLERRASALSDLLRHLKERHNPLSRQTKWYLLSNAEKIAAATAMWRTYQAAIRKHPNDPDMNNPSKRNLLTEAIEYCGSELKTENEPEQYETDVVRHWFAHDVWRIEKLLPYIQNTVGAIVGDMRELAGGRQDEEIEFYDHVRLLGESVDLELAVLETAFRFREMNAASYGIDNEAIVDGVLVRDYEDLPLPWTSGQKVAWVRKQTNAIVEMIERGSEILDDTMPETLEPLLNKLLTDLPSHIQILSQVWIETYRWLRSRPDQDSIKKGERTRAEHRKVRGELLVKLAELGDSQEAARLAEKYENMTALVDIKDFERVEAYKGLGNDPKTLRLALGVLDKHILDYLTKYGTHFADAYFTKNLDAKQASFIFDQSASYQQALTALLRRKPQYAKLRWINEVCAEKNYAAAADSLEQAQELETSLWYRKIEQSMRKLALLAACQQSQIEEPYAKAEIETINSRAATLNEQEQLYDYFGPALNSALDADAEVDLVMDQHFITLIRQQNFLFARTKRVVGQLVARQYLDDEDLIDLLTLMNGVFEDRYVADDGYIELRFFAALQVLRRSKIHSAQPARSDLLRKVIWRRCLIQDDWGAINRTEDKDDTGVKEQTMETAYYKTLRGIFAEEPPFPDPPSPQELLDAGTTIESLRTSDRYRSYSDHELEQLAHDMGLENQQLQRCIEKGRLVEHWQGIVVDAKESVKRAQEEEMERTRLHQEKRKKALADEDTNLKLM